MVDLSSHPLYPVFLQVAAEYNRSVALHCDWRGHSIEAKLLAVSGEYDEVMDAYAINDLYGDHGVVREAIQLANCACKLVLTTGGNDGT